MFTTRTLPSFVIFILLIGIWIARRKGVLQPESWNDLILANKQLGLKVGIFTLIATEVGGAWNLELGSWGLGHGL